jgi:hypothetical protein
LLVITCDLGANYANGDVAVFIMIQPIHVSAKNNYLYTLQSSSDTLGCIYPI